MNTETFSSTGVGQTNISNAGIAKFEVTGTGTVQVETDLIATGSEVTLRSISGPGEDTFVRADGQPFFSGETEYTVGRGPVMITAMDLIAGIKVNSNYEDTLYSVEYYISGSKPFTDRLKHSEQDISQIAQALKMPVQKHADGNYQVERNNVLADSIVILTYKGGPGSNTFLSLDGQPINYYNSGTAIDQIEENVPVYVPSDALIEGIKLKYGGVFDVSYYAPPLKDEFNTIGTKLTANRDDIAQLKSFIGLPPAKPLDDIVFTDDGRSYPPHMVLPSNVKTIGASAYQNFPQLKSVKFSDTVTRIETSAFQGCSGLNKVEYSDSVTFIGLSSFQDCTGLADPKLPVNVSTIEKCAYKGCSGLTGTLVLPETLKFMGNEAFSGCLNITAVEFPKTPVNAPSDCFYHTGIYNMRIPGYMGAIGGGFVENMPNLNSLYIENGATKLSDNFGRDCPMLTDLHLPNTITYLGANVFLGCVLLKNVTLEQGFNANGLNLSSSNCYTAETLAGVLEALADRTGSDSYKLTLGKSNLAKLTDDQKAIASNKNWTLA